MLNIPNSITLIRIALVPVAAYYLWEQDYATAFVVFLSVAVSDFLDGALARRLNQISALGATLDPMADKLNMVSATLMLALHGELPLWLAAAIVVRDVIIVVGAVAYRYKLGRVEIAPTRLSKVNTFFEFAVLLLVMASAAGWVDAPGALQPLFALVFATVLASGLQYVWVWGRKALRESRGTWRPGT